MTSWDSLVGLVQQGVHLFGVAAAAAARPAEQHGERHQALLDAVVEIALDAAALGVHGFDDRGPAGGQLVDALPQQLPLGRPEALTGQPGVQDRERVDALHVEEQQHPAEQRLGEEFLEVEAALDQPYGQHRGEDGTEPQQTDDDGAQQPRVAADRQIAQDLLVGGLVVLGETIAEEDEAARPVQRRDPARPGGERGQGAGPGARPQQEGRHGRADDQQIEQSEHGRAAAEECSGDLARPRGFHRPPAVVLAKVLAGRVGNQAMGGDIRHIPLHGGQA